MARYGGIVLFTLIIATGTGCVTIVGIDREVAMNDARQDVSLTGARVYDECIYTYAPFYLRRWKIKRPVGRSLTFDVGEAVSCVRSEVHISTVIVMLC